MRRISLVVIAALVMAVSSPMLAGCTTAATNTATASDTVVLESTRALLVAEYAYSAAAQAALAATRAGLIKGPDAAKLRSINAAATQALVAGRGARDAVERATQAAIVIDQVARINAMAGEAK